MAASELLVIVKATSARCRANEAGISKMDDLGPLQQKKRAAVPSVRRRMANARVAGFGRTPAILNSGEFSYILRSMELSRVQLHP